MKTRVAFLVALIAAIFIPYNAPAAALSLFWDADGSGSGTGGTGTWDTTSLLWHSGSSTGTLQAYDNSLTFAVNAQFAGTAGTVTLAPSTTINANTITFGTTGYILNGATGSKIVLTGGNGGATPPQITSSVGTATVNAVLDGTGGLDKGGTGTLVLGGANTYTGNTTIRGGTLSVSSIGTTGSTSSNLGAGTSTIHFGVGNNPGTLLYTGAGETTDRIVNISNGNAIIQNNGSGALTFTSNQTATTTSARTFTLSGSNGGTFSGNIVNGSAPTIAVAKDGTGTWALAGANTYTGDTTVSVGTLVLADDGGLRFKIGASGVNNQIKGTGTVTLDGDFTFDLTGAGTTVGNSWVIVDVGTLSESFGSTFSVVGFTEFSNIWTGTAGGATYEFVEATGVLSVVPEPSAALLLGMAGVSLLWMRRRRRLPQAGAFRSFDSRR